MKKLLTLIAFLLCGLAYGQGVGGDWLELTPVPTASQGLIPVGTNFQMSYNPTTGGPQWRVGAGAWQSFGSGGDATAWSTFPALQNVDWDNYWLFDLGQLRFTDTDADTGIWNIAEITNLDYEGDLGFGHLGVFKHMLPQNGQASEDAHLLTKADGDRLYLGTSVNEFQYRYSTGGSTSPSNGRVTADNDTFTATTLLYVNDQDDNGISRELYISRVDSDDRIVIYDQSDGSNAVLFDVTGPAVDNTGSWQIPVSYVDGATSKSNNQQIILGIIWSGQGGGGGGIGGTAVNQRVSFGTGTNTIGESPDLIWTGSGLSIRTGGLAATSVSLDWNNVNFNRTTGASYLNQKGNNSFIFRTQDGLGGDINRIVMEANAPITTTIFDNSNIRITQLGGNGTGYVGVDNSGNLSWSAGSGGGGTPGGSNTTVQWNDNGNFNGTLNFRYVDTDNLYLDNAGLYVWGGIEMRASLKMDGNPMYHGFEEGNLGQRWLFGKSIFNDSFFFGRQNTPETSFGGGFTEIYTLHESGDPVDPIDLVDLEYLQNNTVELHPDSSTPFRLGFGNEAARALATLIPGDAWISSNAPPLFESPNDNIDFSDGNQHYDDRAADVATINFSNLTVDTELQVGAIVKIRYNRAAEPAYAGATMKQLPGTLAFPANTECVGVYEINPDGELDYYFYEVTP